MRTTNSWRDQSFKVNKELRPLVEVVVSLVTCRQKRSCRLGRKNASGRFAGLRTGSKMPVPSVHLFSELFRRPESYSGPSTRDTFVSRFSPLLDSLTTQIPN